MKQIFIKLIFLYKYIMDKVQYILLVFIGLWFVCCFLRFTSSIIFSKIIPVIFALCMIVFSVIALISFQWLYWMMWLIMSWGILITEDIYMHRAKKDDLKRLTQSEFMYRCKCETLEKNIEDLRICNNLLEKNLKIRENDYKELESSAAYWKMKVGQLKFEQKIAEDDIKDLLQRLDATEVPGLKKQIQELEEEREHYRVLYERKEWELKQARMQSKASDIYKNCDSLDSLSKRKKLLLNIFHPDSEGGDNESTRFILEQYNMRKLIISKQCTEIRYNMKRREKV